MAEEKTVSKRNITGASDARVQRMRELIKTLSAAAKAYYVDGAEIMSNFEYDKLYDELQMLENETGIVLSGSLTQRVGYEVLSELPKERHPKPMLSLDKTKSVDDLVQWIGDQEALLSWKMDGLTVVLTYHDGELTKAVTRGNGEIGEVITQNARAFDNVPTRISFKGDLVLRGEAIITYSEFNKINETISEAAAKYKNPRNLCSGSVRQLDPAITKSRHVNLVAFALVSAMESVATPVTAQAPGSAETTTAAAVQATGSAEATTSDASTTTARIHSEAQPMQPVDFHNSREEQFKFLSSLGFDVVGYKRVTKETLAETVKWFSEEIQHNDFPSDGLVLLLDDIAYGESLGTTAKFPRNAIAFKWSDEQAETVLRDVEWSPSRTGLINPVAIFDPVELEGTTVSRASLHNISYCEDMQLGLGDHITVYKANMIIPQIAENLTKSATLKHAKICPACGAATEVRQEQDSKFLYCPNPECPAKKIKNFSLFVSRDALNVDGLSDQTLEKFIGHGFIHTYSDIFHLDRHRDEIIAMDGFGEKSYENLKAAADRASHTTLYRVVYGLGIGGIGLANAKVLCRHFGEELSRLREATQEELLEVDGIGDVLAASVVAYFRDADKMAALDQLLPDLTIEKPRNTAAEAFFGSNASTGADLTASGNNRDSNFREDSDSDTGLSTIQGADKNIEESTAGTNKNVNAAEESEGRADIEYVNGIPQTMAGKSVCITGALNHFTNRKELQELIEAAGGRAAGSVSGKTAYLVNNDVTSQSGKNKKAKELGVPIVSEDEFLRILRGE